jgi:hypothetical protein
VLQSIVEAHPELCHYRGAAGLKGIIIESNSFRATYFADMNDAQEIHALRVHLVDELKKRLETAVKQAPPGFSCSGRSTIEHIRRNFGLALSELLLASPDSIAGARASVASFRHLIRARRIFSAGPASRRHFGASGQRRPLRN